MWRIRATVVTVGEQKVLHVYSECVFVALVIQHEMRKRYTVIRSLSYFINGTIFENKNKNKKIYRT
jgi:hypothetical protein